MSGPVTRALAFAIELLAIVAAIVLLLSFPSPCHGQSPRPSRWTWSVPQRQGAALYVSAVAMDCATTQVALGRPDNHESNPLLGPRPSAGRLWSMCAVATVSTLALAHLVGRRARGWVIGAAWALEMLMAAQNLSLVLHER